MLYKYLRIFVYIIQGGISKYIKKYPQMQILSKLSEIGKFINVLKFYSKLEIDIRNLYQEIRLVMFTT